MGDLIFHLKSKAPNTKSQIPSSKSQIPRVERDIISLFGCNRAVHFSFFLLEIWSLEFGAWVFILGIWSLEFGAWVFPLPPTNLSHLSVTSKMRNFAEKLLL